MTPLGAAAATGLPVGWLALAALVWVLGYVVACAVWPFTAHRRCGGTGKRRSPSGRAWRACKGCAGTGRKIRTGRKLWAAARTIDRKGRGPS
ncbi:MAG: hypothetical protein M3R63_19955 [Actinomycetota bacterium]|nr:hypothetical protein [Actinomycetota bacterium]